MIIITNEEWKRFHQISKTDAEEHTQLRLRDEALRTRMMKQMLNIVTLANREHDHSSLNEEYEKIAKKYHDNEITREEFLEEYELLKVAMKLIDE